MKTIGINKLGVSITSEESRAIQSLAKIYFGLRDLKITSEQLDPYYHSEDAKALLSMLHVEGKYLSEYSKKRKVAQMQPRFFKALLNCCMNVSFVRPTLEQLQLLVGVIKKIDDAIHKSKPSTAQPTPASGHTPAEE